MRSQLSGKVAKRVLCIYYVVCCFVYFIVLYIFVSHLDIICTVYVRIVFNQIFIGRKNICSNVVRILAVEKPMYCIMQLVVRTLLFHIVS